MKGESDIHPSIHRCRADVAAFQSLTHLYSVSLLRTTEWTSSWDSSGTTLGWPTASTPTTRWTLTPLCWTPSGNLTCSSLTRRAPTSTRSPPTTSCYASLKTATCSTAYGEWRKCEVSDANCEWSLLGLLITTAWTHLNFPWKYTKWKKILRILVE